MRNEHYTPTADDLAGDMQGDIEAAKWDKSQNDASEREYYERLAFSNPEDDTTRQAQRWLEAYKLDQLRTDAN